MTKNPPLLEGLDLEQRIPVSDDPYDEEYYPRDDDSDEPEGTEFNS